VKLDDPRPRESTTMTTPVMAAVATASSSAHRGPAIHALSWDRDRR
jgi:hypothetical protein